MSFSFSIFNLPMHIWWYIYDIVCRMCCLPLYMKESNENCELHIRCVSFSFIFANERNTDFKVNENFRTGCTSGGMMHDLLLGIVSHHLSKHTIESKGKCLKEVKFPHKKKHRHTLFYARNWHIQTNTKTNFQISIKR